jgi:lysophospholipase L1-like esterase
MKIMTRSTLAILLGLLLFPSVLIAQRMNRSPTHIEYSFLKQNFVVLFQGDSITDGGRQKTGNDLNHIMGQDYAYILSAEIGSDIPDRNLHFINRGVSGERIVDLAARWKEDTLALKPDVLSVLVGINDLFGSRELLTTEEFLAYYDKLLAETVAALPGTKIVLGEPFLLPVGKHQANYAQEMSELKRRQAIVAQLGAKYHLPVIHYQQAFDDALKKAPAEYWCWDGVHPTYAGHGLMARLWLRVTSEAWDTN